MKRQSFAVAAMAFIALFTLAADIRANHPGARSISSAKKTVVQTSRGNVVQVRSVTSRAYTRQYRGWNKYCYYPSLSCYGFYDPQCGCWFYWYEPQGRFLPIAYVASYPPQTNGAAYLPQAAGYEAAPAGPVVPVESVPVPTSRRTESANPLESPTSVGGDGQQ